MLRIDEQASGTEVRVPVGETFEVGLAENSTTGFRWVLVSDGSPHCALVADEFRSPGHDAPGRAGVHCWRFRAEHAGRAGIALASRRPWETGSSGRTFALGVVVEP
jgi:predicted secreted protein